MDRVALAPGFSISFSKDGRSLAHGKADLEAVEYIEDWLDLNKSDRRSTIVQQWLNNKLQELAMREAELEAARRKPRATRKAFG